MNILLINPNTSEFVTERAVAAARAVASPGTVIHGVTATFGAPIVNSEADLAIGTYAALELAAKHAHRYDAIGLAVSFDCGLDAIREICHKPVVGLAQASIQQAMRVAGRFAVISFAERTAPLYLKLVQQYASSERLATVKCLPTLPLQVLRNPAQLTLEVEKFMLDLIEQTDCQSLVLLATAFAGLSFDRVNNIELVDCVSAMVGQLEECILQPELGRAFSSAIFPERKTIQGVSAELARLYAEFPID